MRTFPLILAAALALAGCNRTSQEQQQPQEKQDANAPVATPAPDGSLPKTTITLYFPSATDDRLVAETREIVDTARPAERGTQVLVELMAGPKDKGALPAVPEGTTLRQLWIGKSGIAWADFSEELATGLKGGVLRVGALAAWAFPSGSSPGTDQTRACLLDLSGSRAAHIQRRGGSPSHSRF